MKFTFKTEKPTGKYSSFFETHHYVKLKKVEVGMISDKFPHRISLQVYKDDLLEDGNENCEWKWIKLKKESKNLIEAKEFLNKNIELILEKFNLVTK